MTIDRRHSKYDSGIVIAVITIVIGFFGYCGDNAYKGILNSIADSKAESLSHYERIWGALSSNKNRIDCIQNQLAKCCKDSTYCV